ncbi:MAG: LptF/LptG family permease [Candidatus Methylacidiphilales bacterium]|nr:LptF/LptG family permease [Candidatus Methylacidiphilales bacterium]
MKIFFRYILLELIQPFFFILIACVALWVVADLFGTLDDFLENKAAWTVVLQYYLAQFPSIMVTMLPVALLFASLYTLLRLNSHSEFIAFMAGGISPFKLFTPFVALGVLCGAFLSYLMYAPVAASKQRRTTIMAEMNNKGVAKDDEIRNLVWHDNATNRMWFIGTLNPQTGRAYNIQIIQRDANHKATETINAVQGQWNGTYWQLTYIRRQVHGPLGDKQPVLSPKLDATDMKTSPLQLSYVRAEPTQLTVPQLKEFLETATTDNEEILAKYRTELAYNRAYPWSTMVLVLFALALGSEFGRRNVAAGVFNSIFVLIGFLFIHELCLAMGRGNRIPPTLSAWMPHVVFGGVAFWMLGQKFGWFWAFVRWASRSGPDHRLDGAPIEGGRNFLAGTQGSSKGQQKRWSDRL